MRYFEQPLSRNAHKDTRRIHINKTTSRQEVRLAAHLVTAEVSSFGHLGTAHVNVLRKGHAHITDAICAPRN